MHKVTLVLAAKKVYKLSKYFRISLVIIFKSGQNLTFFACILYIATIIYYCVCLNVFFPRCTLSRPLVEILVKAGRSGAGQTPIGGRY